MSPSKTDESPSRPPAQFLALPQNDEELYHYVQILWGMRIPRTRVCADHQTPFDAFADAYFARSPVSVWKASRGFGGKSRTLALLSLTEAVFLGAQVTILGGSAAQSYTVHEGTTEAWYWKAAPRELLDRDPTAMSTYLRNGAHIRALMASQRSVRGPHPQRLRLDEIDEMELSILEAAQGQPMDARGIRAQTVMSSTHQYADGTMTEMLKRAGDKGWNVFTWCYKECSNPIDGWLQADAIERKRHEVSTRMFNVEYDLQEPSVEGRAFDTEAVERMFDATDVVSDEPNVEHVYEEPRPRTKYVTGVDWAREQDWTVISTWDITSNPWHRVAWERTQRLPYPVMVGKVMKRIGKYPGVLAHDATGLGTVVSDLLDEARVRMDVRDIVMVGRARESLFSEFIAGVEHQGLVSPRIPWAFNEMRLCKVEDLYSGYGTKGHPPDSVVADALAWSCRNTTKLAAPIFEEFTRESPWKW